MGEGEFVLSEPGPRTPSEPQLKLPTDPDGWQKEGGDTLLEAPRTPGTRFWEAEDVSPMETSELPCVGEDDSPVEYSHMPNAMHSGTATPTWARTRSNKTGTEIEDNVKPFERALEACGRYPLSAAFVEPQSIAQRLQAEIRRGHLNDIGPRILRDSAQDIVMWETHPEADTENPGKSFTRFQKYSISSAGELDTHLQRPGATPESNSVPITRVILLASEERKGVLPCGREMLNKLLTYFQVDHSFIESIRSFENAPGFARLSSAPFWCRSTALAPARQPAPPGSQCRPGGDISMSFTLHTIRPDDYGQWPIERRAVYGLLDFETGRSTRLVVSDNDWKARIGCSVRERIQKMLDSHPLAAIGSDLGEETVAEPFEAFLEHYLFFITWCEENWRDFMAAVDTEVDQILERATGIKDSAYVKQARESDPPAVPSPPISPMAVRQPQRHGLGQGLNRGGRNRKDPRVKSQGTVSLGPEAATLGKADIFPRDTRGMGQGLQQLPGKTDVTKQELEENKHQEEALKSLCHEDLQALHANAATVHAAKEAVICNIDVIVRATALLLDTDWRVFKDAGRKSGPNQRNGLDKLLQLAAQSQYHLEMMGGRLGHLGSKIVHGAQRYEGLLHHRMRLSNDRMLQEISLTLAGSLGRGGLTTECAKEAGDGEAASSSASTLDSRPQADDKGVTLALIACAAVFVSVLGVLLILQTLVAAPIWFCSLLFGWVFR
ncbi:hypothetical protein RB601_007882 [Gaeumannomyces tritici]